MWQHQLSQHDFDDMDVDSFEQVEVSVSSTLDEDVMAAVQLYDEVVGGELSVQEVCSSTSLDKIQEKLQIQKIQMTSSRTSKLWLQYIEMVDILRLFIKADRTGDWMLHLKSLQKMLQFFAASGHNLYAKSAYIYVQQMLQLGGLQTCWPSSMSFAGATATGVASHQTW